MSATTKFAHELEPGDEYAPLEFAVTAEMNQQFLFAQEDFDPRYLAGHAGRPALVHPAILLQMAANTKSPSFKLAPGTGSILAEADTTFHSAVSIGTKLVVRWRVTERYEKRGRSYYVMLAEIADEHGTPVLRRALHLAFPRRESA
jgi:hypothetical protein